MEKTIHWKSFRSYAFIALILSISSFGCRSFPKDIDVLIQSQQTGMIWVNPSSSFSLTNPSGARPFKSHEKVLVKFNRGGEYAWNDSPTIELTGESGSAKITVPTYFIENYGKILPAQASGQPYQIKFFRILHSTKDWVESRKVDDSTTTTDAEGNSTGTVTYTNKYDDYYMDGTIEYRLAFYDIGTNRIDAIVYLKKSVTKFLKKTIQTQ